MSQNLLQRKRFFCREWVFNKISHYLENYSSSKTCGTLLIGGPGSGKTALCCELVWPTNPQGKQNVLHKQLLAFHFCQAHDIESLSLTHFITNIINQLTASSLIVGYSDRIKSPDIEIALQFVECERNPDEAFKKGVLFPLLEIEPPEQPCFIIVDSVDQSILGLVSEKFNGTSRNIAELLSNYHHLFPRWLLLICSSRKQNKGVTQMFIGFRKISLDDLRKSYVVRDVQQYILCRLDQEESLRQHLSRETAEMLNQLHIKSNGCFMYLEKVLDGVSENFIMLREIKEIPGTLNGLYLWLCQRIFNKKQFNKVQAILNVILASRKPFTKEVLFQCVWTSNINLTWEEFLKRLKILSKVLVDGRNETKILFHHSFAEWLLDVKHCTLKYLCNVKKGHFMIALWYTIASPVLEEDIVDFALHLSKIPLTSSLQSHHITLWLMHCNLPLHVGSKNSILLRDPSVLTLLVSAGAKVASLYSDEHSINLPEDTLHDSIPSLVDINKADNNKQTLLHNACQEGNDNLVLKLVAKGADLKLTDSYGQSAINIAARLGHHGIMEILVKAGVDLNHADNDGWTPLRSAAWAGYTEVVNILLENGAQVDLEDADHRTALRAAAWGGHEEIVSQLLKHEACVNKIDNEGRTALIAAAYMGHAEIVDQLLDHGAQINHEDNDGRTALCVAALCVPASEDHAKVVSLLLERGAEVDHTDKEGMTPLLVAAFEGHSEVCELLLENEADVDHADHNGRTPLLAAASMGHPSVVKLLLFWGAAVDTIDAEGRTVLSIASAQGNADIVGQLLDRGLDEIHRDNGGWTPMHYAAFEGHSEVCELLLDAGARITEVDNDGRIPLILAAQEGHAALVSTLLQNNLTIIDSRTHDGKTAMRVACLERHKDTVQMLINYGADINYKDADGRSTLYLLALDNHTEMAEFLLSKGAIVGVKDLEGRTALHVSAWQGHLDMVQVLIRYGADVNDVDNDCRTALQSAAWQGHVPVVHFLLERKATVDHVCNQGATALCIAAQEGHLEVVKVLLEYGADPSHADQFGRNPIRVASKGGHDIVVHLLEEYTSLLQKGEKVTFSVSLSNVSLTSTATAETKPCSASLSQHNCKEQSLSVSPESSTYKRRSFVSNQSSKSSSNLTNSTNMSSSTPLTVLPDEKIKCFPKSSKESKSSVVTHLTFTQQIQECTRNKNRISRPTSDCNNIVSSSMMVSEVQSSPVHSSNAAVIPNELSMQIKSSNASKKSSFCNCKMDSGFPIIKPTELHLRRSGIVTNPNIKSNYFISSKNNSVEKSIVNNQVKSIKAKYSHSEDSHANPPFVKKETHL